MRIDRFVANLPGFNRQRARLALAKGDVYLGATAIDDPAHDVRIFDRIEVSGEVVQPGYAARYLMLHKPAGCVSATADPEHPTVLDCLPQAEREGLHLAGRLDFNTTGLVLLTNDGQWSRRLTLPTSKLPKLYDVETEGPIEAHYARAFEQGLYFAYENLTTLPAMLDILEPRRAYLSLMEGRYHQVKRMFGHFQNKVTRLHRLAIGPLRLDPTLAPGQWRSLTEEELSSLSRAAENVATEQK
ncbi:16S rRNA pseudouridine(516) synthase [Pseudomonas massiliensis]|uniref:16S rRNA pseudouridine(516) synthase n=1 Tax=Pseudomonas massiliensis TaxID=522492 RepID=UPI00058D8AD6|nr:pseudouridine synthase [Pseudomonas massiliensis]